MPDLEYDRRHDRPIVISAEGDVWTPDNSTAAEIDSDSDPECLAIAICESEPMRGVWQS